MVHKRKTETEEEFTIRRRDYEKDYRKRNLERIHEYDRKRNRRRIIYIRNYHRTCMVSKRLEIIELLGGKCINPYNLLPHPDWCNDSRCLQIDHINSRDIKKPITFYYTKILREIKSGSKDYQCLCANCNWIKRYENKELEKRK